MNDKKSIYLLRIINYGVEGGFIGFKSDCKESYSVSLNEAKVFQGEADKMITKYLKIASTIPSPWHSSQKLSDIIELKPVYIHLSATWNEEEKYILSITDCDMKICPQLIRDKKMENILD